MEILKVLVGSRAHGLHNDDSDYDYRSVFVAPTSKILSLGAQPKSTVWIEGTGAGRTDDTSWEVKHFLDLAVHCNPTILEVFVAPVVQASEFSYRLRGLFQYIWSPVAVRDAFIGYGHNQRKKFLDNKDNRSNKYAVAYLRVLYQARELLSKGYLPVDMQLTEVYDTLKRWRLGNMSSGEVIDTTEEWTYKVHCASAGCTQKPDVERANDFLLDIRRQCW